MRLENGAMHLEAGLSGPNRADVRDNHPLVSSSLRDLARATQLPADGRIRLPEADSESVRTDILLTAWIPCMTFSKQIYRSSSTNNKFRSPVSNII